MKEDFDPQMEALGNRKMKGAMRIVVDVSPDGKVSANHEGAAEEEHADEGQDKALIKEMMHSEEMKDKKASDDEYAQDEKTANEQMLGGMSPEEIMDQYRDSEPKSLGAKVRLSVAKKSMKA